MKRMMLLVMMMIVGMGCGNDGKGLTKILPTGPSDVMAASKNNESVSTGVAALAFSAPSSVRVGEEFTVEIRVDNVNLFGASYVVLIDSALQFIRIEEEDFLKKDNKPTSLMKSLRDGELTVGQTRLGYDLPNVSGSGAIAKITFRAISAGNIELRFKDVYLKEHFTENGESLLRSIICSEQNATLRVE